MRHVKAAQNTRNPAEVHMAKLHGAICWGVQYDGTAGLSMSFGLPKFRVLARAPIGLSAAADNAVPHIVDVKGEWWLWLQHAYWQLTHNGSRMVSTSSAVHRIRRYTRLLEGRPLRHVEICAQDGTTRLMLGAGTVLDIRRKRVAAGEQLWLLFEPGGYCLSVRGDGTYDHEPCSGTDGRPKVARRRLA